MDEKICVPGIYIIRVMDDSLRVYVGSASNLSKRFTGHKVDLRKGKHHNRHLQHIYNKYGENILSFEIILRCSKDELRSLESEYMQKYEDFGYCLINHTRCTTNPMDDPNVREKQKKAMQNLWSSDEFRSMQSSMRTKANNDPEFKAKMSLVTSSLHKDPIYKAKITEAIKHKWKTDAAFRQKHSDMLKLRNETKVVCVELKICFLSMKDAILHLYNEGIIHRVVQSSCLSRPCKTGRTAYGFHWNYI